MKKRQWKIIENAEKAVTGKSREEAMEFFLELLDPVLGELLSSGHISVKEFTALYAMAEAVSESKK